MMPRHGPNHPSFFLLALLAGYCFETGQAFTTTRPFVVIQRPFVATTRRHMDLFEDVSETVRIAKDVPVMKAPSTATKSTTDEPVVLVDRHGNEFQVGGVVRVCVENIRQFQIPPMGAGQYNESKTFVPESSTSDPNNNKSSLILPVGLRGTIVKLYQQANLSANYPIQVAFAPGEHVGEGYDPPVKFSMHFAASELECIVAIDKD